MIKVLSADTEYSPTGKFVCASFSNGTQSWVEWGQVDPGTKKMLADPLITKVFAAAKGDLRIFKQVDAEINGPIDDIILMAKVINEKLPSYSLKNLMYYFYGDLHMEQLALQTWFLANKMRRDGDMSKAPRELVGPYAIKDAKYTLMLRQLFWKMIKKENLMAGYVTERLVIRPVYRMENNGITIDREWVKKFYRESMEEKDQLKMRGYAITGKTDFNVNSAAQMGDYLVDQGIAVEKTEKGNYKLDKRTRKGIDHEIVKVKDRIAILSKQTGTYCENLLEATKFSCRIRPTFNISFAATRRFSSGGMGDKLNWQNVPPELRGAVVIPKGQVGWFFDYRQIENVIHIFFSDDSVRRKAYEDDEEWSEYLWLAEQVLGERITKEDSRYKRLKSTKLGMNYGMGVKTFARYNNLAQSEAYALFSDVFRACPAIKKLTQEVAEALRLYGCVYDVFGYCYHGTPESAYKVVAYMIQGCAAALMKQAIIRADKIEGVKLRLTVHDELFFTTKDDDRQYDLARQVRHAMTDFSDRFGGIPIRVECFRSTTNWADKQKVKL